MELCTVQAAVSYLPNNHRFLTAKYHALVRTRNSLFLKQTSLSRFGYGLPSRIVYYTNPLPRATSEEASNGANQYVGDKRDSVVILEDVPPAERNVYSESLPTELPKEESPVDEQTNELLDNLNIKFDSEDTYSILIFAGGALVSLWLAFAVVGAIDSIPLFPKLMEVVGLGYTFWFTSRYLVFKKNRDELAAKIEELKQQVLGSNDD
ncbi:hypothetical protein Ddye_009606 [Dipteronia dyeriana]|uniref:Cyanobacterial aminoacyl-tRNA synthetase CAAD domain-containing protein n=1 Tax=Dipteronia dyeriana TaxID=168575 RepID=A0AAD9XBQ7_9ROSI|nr:hypothetical protein Ddye_009606 [Dipteronia dyeriana]